MSAFVTENLVTEKSLLESLSEVPGPAIADLGQTTEAEALSYQTFLNWIEAGRGRDFSYLTCSERSRQRRSLKDCFPQFQQALVFLFPYTPIRKTRISSYVLGFQGRDYHFEVRDKLQKIAERLCERNGVSEFQIALDTSPVLERDLAVRAGLGWIGKNSMLINRVHGSTFIIGSLLVDRLVIQPANRLREMDHCGSCTACIDACPTQAIDGLTRTLIADRCIATHTIERFKETDPVVDYESKGEWWFGCDICQTVCPWNRKIPTIPNLSPVSEQEKLISTFFLERSVEEVFTSLKSMSNREYRKMFRETPLARTGRVGMMKNIKIYIQAIKEEL